ncbi:MAG: hypothetical protein V1694_08015 [Candidatus Eisenbacteria bacterium]
MREHKWFGFECDVYGACGYIADHVYGDGDSHEQLWHLFAW